MKCWLPAFSPCPTMFSKSFFHEIVKVRIVRRQTERERERERGGEREERERERERGGVERDRQTDHTVYVPGSGSRQTSSPSMDASLN